MTQTPTISDVKTAPWPRRLAVAAVAVVVFVAATALAFAPFGQFYLAWVGAIPLLWAIGNARSQWTALLIGYAAGLGYFGVGLWYLWFIGPWPMVGSFVYLACYFALFAVLWRPLANRRPSVAVFASALLWVGVDWLRGTLFTGLPYLLLGHTQSPMRAMIQIADFAGTYGVTFWVVLVNAGLLALWVNRRRIKIALPGVAAVAALLVFVGVYGGWRLAQTDPTPGPDVALLQPDFPLLNTEPLDDEAVVAWHAQATRRAIREHPDADLIVWPESMAPTLNPSARDVYAGYPRLVNGQLVPETHAFLVSASAAGPALLVGGSYGNDWHERTTPADKGSLDYPLPNDRRNSFYLYRDGEQSPLRYDKTHLFPYGEYIPFKDWPPPIRWLYDLAQLFNPWGEEASVTPGTERTVFDLTTRRGTPYRAVTPICFEDIIPPQTRALCYEPGGTKRADVIVNGTNDGWFRGNQMRQHLQAALFRSVENRVPTVRSVNTGGTAVVDSTGRVLATLASGSAGILSAAVPLDARSSVYGRVGDAFAAACFAVTLAWALWLAVAGVRRRYGKRRLAKD